MDKHISAASDTGAPGAPLDRRDYTIILAAVVCALVIRLVFFRGVLSIDDFNYLRHAAEMWKDRFSYGDLLYLHGTRSLVFVPVSWLYAVFGVSEAAAAAWPLAASFATIAFVYLIGREWFGREGGAWAAVLAVFLPLMVEESTRILPGAIMNLIIAVSVYTFVLSERGRRRWLWLLVSGGVYGAMPLTGELGMLFGCFFPIAVLVIGRYRFWSYWPIAAGFIVVAGSNVAYQWIVTGDPLFKAHISALILETEVPPVRPFYYVNVLLRPFAGHGGVFYLAGAGAVAALRARNRPALFLTGFLVAMWVLIEFISSSVTTYRPLYKYVRYASMLSVPAVVLSGYGLVWIRRSLGGPGARRGFGRAGSVAVVSIVALLFLTSIVTLKKAGSWAGKRRAQLERLGGYVTAAQGKPVYVTHWLWNTRAGYFMDFDDAYFPSGYDPYHALRLDAADAGSLNRYVQTLTAGEELRGGLLIHDETLFAAGLSAGRTEGRDYSVGTGEIPSLLASPPAAWRLVDRFEVGNNTLAVYEIPDGFRWPVEE